MTSRRCAGRDRRPRVAGAAPAPGSATPPPQCIRARKLAVWGEGHGEERRPRPAALDGDHARALVTASPAWRALDAHGHPLLPRPPERVAPQRHGRRHRPAAREPRPGPFGLRVDVPEHGDVAAERRPNAVERHGELVDPARRLDLLARRASGPGLFPDPVQLSRLRARAAVQPLQPPCGNDAHPTTRATSERPGREAPRPHASAAIHRTSTPTHGDAMAVGQPKRRPGDPRKEEYDQGDASPPVARRREMQRDDRGRTAASGSRPSVGVRGPARRRRAAAPARMLAGSPGRKRSGPRRSRRRPARRRARRPGRARRAVSPPRPETGRFASPRMRRTVLTTMSPEAQLFSIEQSGESAERAVPHAGRDGDDRRTRAAHHRRSAPSIPATR